MRRLAAVLVTAAALGSAGVARAEPALREESWTVPTLHGLGLMTTMRVTEAFIWPEPFAETDLSLWLDSYEEAFTRPPKWDWSRRPFEWDGDPWYVNAVGHALFGSELHLRARSCKKSVVESLLFTAAGSAVWEYAFEANRVRPSALDLWYTPAAGLVLGEARHALWSAAARLGDPGWRSVLMAVFDPFGELERALGTPC
jgi:hypothetical protein